MDAGTWCVLISCVAVSTLGWAVLRRRHRRPPRNWLWDQTTQRLWDPARAGGVYRSRWAALNSKPRAAPAEWPPLNRGRFDRERARRRRNTLAGP